MWTGVDLDGTLAKTTGGSDIGPPVKLMADRVIGWIMEGREVRILTARDESQWGRINDWLRKHIGPYEIEVTNSKDKYLLEMWDDKAVCVKRNTGAAIRFDNDKEGFSIVEV